MASETGKEQGGGECGGGTVLDVCQCGCFATILLHTASSVLTAVETEELCDLVVMAARGSPSPLLPPCPPSFPVAKPLVWGIKQEVE